MTISLSKGANTALLVPSLQAVVSWRAAGTRAEIDVSALLLTDSGKVRSDADFVFYNQPTHAASAVAYQGRQSSGDRSGDAISLDTAHVEPDVTRVVIGASIEGGTFGDVPGLRLDLVDAATGADLVSFDIADATTETAYLFGEAYVRNGEWKFRAVGQGYATGLAGLATDFGISVDDEPVPAPTASAPAPAAPASGISLKKQKLVDMEKKVAATSPQLLSLTKTAGVSLEKRGLGEHTARVALCLDISGSMAALYGTGKIQKLAERILALGLRFDDDGEVDVFLFGKKGYAVGTLNLGNVAQFTQQTLQRYGLEVSTHYGKAMALVREHYFGSSAKRRDVLGGQQLPVYCMFVTDGAASDPGETTEQVRSSSYEPLFWQFLAIGRSAKSLDARRNGRSGRSRFSGRSEFDLLEKLDDLGGRLIDNADFFSVEEPSSIPDEELFDLLMTEYPGWIQLARNARILP